MMRKLLLIAIFYIGFLSFALAQKPQVILFPELYSTLNKQNDTTYVINFWATWCKPCVHELGDFEELNKFSLNKKLKLVLVSLDFIKDYDKLVSFVKKNSLQSTVVLLNEPDYNSWIDRVSTEWGGSIPATMIYNHSSGFRKFYEQEFTFDELQHIIKPILKQ